MDVNWSAPAANGSAITGYEVTANGQRRQAGSGPVRLTIDCQGACWSVRVDAAVTATNGAGPGPAGASRYTHQAPPAVPENGDHVISSWEEIARCVGSGCRTISTGSSSTSARPPPGGTSPARARSAATAAA